MDARSERPVGVVRVGTRALRVRGLGSGLDRDRILGGADMAQVRSWAGWLSTLLKLHGFNACADQPRLG